MNRLVLIALSLFVTTDVALGQTAPPGAGGPAPLIEKPLRFGGRLGLNFARVESDPDLGDDQESRLGIAISGFATMSFGPSFALEGGVGYSQRGFKLDLSDLGGGTGTVALDYLEFPVTAIGRFPVAPTVRLRGFAGGSLGLNVSATSELDGQSEDLEDVTPIDLGIIIGAGADISMGTSLLIFDLRFELGLINAVDDDSSDEAFNRVVSLNGGFAF